MFKKLALLAAAGGGYVLGAKAGRGRYEQIRSGAQRLAKNPKVQEATQKAQDTVSTQASHAADAAKDKMSGDHDNPADEVRYQASIQPGP